MEMMKLIATAAVLLVLTPQWVDSTVTSIIHSKGRALMKRGILSNMPSAPCTPDLEGKIAPVENETIWLCTEGNWLPYRPQKLHNTKAGYLCLEVRDVLPTTPPSGVYYLNITDPCSTSIDITKVYCNMDEDGGGWTLVWKHSAMEVLPLTEDMKYFSDYYKACTDLEVGWCTIPKKARLNSTEMMIAAYHNQRLVYAYKGIFNKNLGKNWGGGVLVDSKKVVDLCTNNNGVQPAPAFVDSLGGLSFDKASPYDYTQDCDVYDGSLSSPTDCRWESCRLPTNISSSSIHTQMTVAIYIR